MNGALNRQKLEQERKQRSHVQEIEAHIPSPKTTSTIMYKTHITYLMQHMVTLFNFYNFNTARLRWCNYIGSQYAIDSAVNILINGSKKYNKNRRNRTKQNKKRREKTAARYERSPVQQREREPRYYSYYFVLMPH